MYIAVCLPWRTPALLNDATVQRHHVAKRLDTKQTHCLNCTCCSSMKSDCIVITAAATVFTSQRRAIHWTVQLLCCNTITVCL